MFATVLSEFPGNVITIKLESFYSILDILSLRRKKYFCYR